MFLYHSQIKYIINELKNNTIGDLRLIRIDFGFPFRGKEDFRYNKEMGGGALLDCGGYTIKLASVFLGESAAAVQSRSHKKEGFDVDIYGTATMINDEGLTAQLSFGMDNEYRCSLDIWGSDGSLFTDRILTAPEDFSPSLQIKKGGKTEKKQLPPDDTFRKSIEFFYECIMQNETRTTNYKSILKQAELVEGFHND
jgi:hypothetical protein